MEHTETGRQAIEVCNIVITPVSVKRPRVNLKLEDRNVYELMYILHSLGWKHRVVKKLRDMPSFDPDDQNTLTWYTKYRVESISHKYLVALVKGTHIVHHGLVANDYATLVGLVDLEKPVKWKKIQALEYDWDPVPEQKRAIKNMCPNLNTSSTFSHFQLSQD